MDISNLLPFISNDLSKGNEVFMKNWKNYVTVENALCLSVILCPIWDIISFLFRSAYGTNYSPSTFLRPVLPIICFILLFFSSKQKRKNNLRITCVLRLWHYPFMPFSDVKSGKLL